MCTKDRLKEFRKHPINTLNDDELLSADNLQLEDRQSPEHAHHLIGSGGRLADFFDNVDNISIAIDGVKKSVEEVESKQREILSKPGNQKLLDELEDLQSDIKQRINGKIRAKVIFVHT